MLNIKYTKLLSSLNDIKEGRNIQINTINAHSYNVAKNDSTFAKVLFESDYLLPDGQSVAWAKKWLTGEKVKRIAGYDLFLWEMQRINAMGGKCFFLGSTKETLLKIKAKATLEFPNVILESFSPPYKSEFSDEDNQEIIGAVNCFKPDVLFVGMTAPKQEKWVFQNLQDLQVGHICSIGAVFDFYAENIPRAPQKWQEVGLEWLFRLINEPKRMWKRYIWGNTLFICYIFQEKFFLK